MEGTKKCSSSSSQVHVVAPFVMKTYDMVCEPRTDAIIRWGRDNNSFLVLDPSRFSQLLLPSYFKHNNFSSFVRQLNTYGFRKVDPDHWEFAHESFLRGQIHLLPLLARRNKDSCDGGAGKEHSVDKVDVGEEEETLLQEVGRLRREQKAIGEELDSMSERLLAAERRPRQMVSFLIKLSQDAELLPRLVMSKKEAQRKSKKRRLCAGHDSSSLPPLPQSLHEHYSRSGEMTSSSRGFDDSDCCCYSDSVDDAVTVPTQHDGATWSSRSMILSPELEDTDTGEEKCVAYPFSLLGHILF
ncbi:heat stress transcription factor C-1b-like [Iris pallida]|uniref:Heat stress transcription factor C-1b-like n=1 Tax=Iris pallida TaxID=29817 RepID=A0AAX6GQA9_IRIPA|nr:heat stress transcription factor C-1b-like [Iris pallida]